VAWSAKHTIYMLLATLSDAEVQAAYVKSSGCCLPHFRQACLSAGWDYLAFLADDMERRLLALGSPGGPDEALLDVAAGMDRDAGEQDREQEGEAAIARPEHGTALRAVEPTPSTGRRAPASSPTLQKMLALLEESGCPVCTACERGLREYFQWLAGEMETAAPESWHWDSSWHVCPAHLQDLRAAGHKRAAVTIAEQVRRAWLYKTENLRATLTVRRPARLTARLTGLPSAWSRCLNDEEASGDLRLWLRRLWRVTVAAIESPDRFLNRRRGALALTDQCQACAHIRETTGRSLDLILRLVEDPVGRQASQRAWGLCFRHCAAAARIAEVPDALAELVTAQIARLRLLEWELEEDARKSSWSVRYESKGPEESAWRRAAYQLSGSF
jgi:hypothetical protein